MVYIFNLTSFLAGCSPTRGWVDTEDESIPDESFLSVPTFPTSLQVFASVGGLALLAEHLPLLYPEISRHSSQSTPGPSTNGKPSSDSSEFFDWVTVEPFPEDFYEVIGKDRYILFHWIL